MVVIQHSQISFQPWMFPITVFISCEKAGSHTPCQPGACHTHKHTHTHTPISPYLSLPSSLPGSEGGSCCLLMLFCSWAFSNNSHHLGATAEVALLTHTHTHTHTQTHSVPPSLSPLSLV